ncbi:Cytochrome c oxidase subunit 3 [BD1-7 clade bacterium]|uniref:cytochrome-c oxidase n=1 Tax=BD1-7 clade bacterium TaxID=2029982 RepID=A0A5S9QDV5_9GAMM|nr:Cytochrome c oxidase subunit 3 [BD1-7 clade bacterium]
MAGQNNSDHQTYYVPEQSRMAILASIGLAMIAVGAAGYINSLTFDTDGSTSGVILVSGLLFFTAVLSTWFGLTIKENLNGMNSEQLKRSYRIGMQWFIFSEVMFFAAFFGALFYVRNLAGPWLAGDSEAGAMNHILWPSFEYNWPMLTTPQDAVGGIDTQAAMGHVANNGTHTGPENHMMFPGFEKMLGWLPLWNTLLLVTSSVLLEFAHHALKAGKRGAFNAWLGATLVLGFVFVGLQALEYYEAYEHYGLYLDSGIYGATFFMLTGFHGFHVIMGAVMLSVQFFRSVFKGHFTSEDHFGFEAASWYWHFVDVVWILLVVVVYFV